MTVRVVDHLAETGGSSLAEVMIRVSIPPHRVAEQLRVLSEKGFLSTKTPGSIEKLREIVGEIRKTNGYDSYAATQQKAVVLKEVYNHHREIADAKVGLSTKGFAYGLD